MFIYHMYNTVDISLKEFITLNVFAPDFFKNLYTEHTIGYKKWPSCMPLEINT